MNAVPKCKCCNHLYSAQTFDDVLLYLILRTIFIIHRVRALFYKLSFNHYIHYFAISIHFNHSLEIASVQFFCASASKCSQKLKRFKTVRLKRMFDNVFFFSRFGVWVYLSNCVFRICTWTTFNIEIEQVKLLFVMWYSECLLFIVVVTIWKRVNRHPFILYLFK